MGCRRREEAIPWVEDLDEIYSERGSVKDSCVHLSATKEFGQRTGEDLRFSEGAYKGDLVVWYEV